ncbi:TPA: hypothetical protein ACKP22_003130 [Pseudomonas putida]
MKRVITLIRKVFIDGEHRWYLMIDPGSNALRHNITGCRLKWKTTLTIAERPWLSTA